jgi:hypothetical protein
LADELRSAKTTLLSAMPPVGHAAFAVTGNHRRHERTIMIAAT